MLERQKPRAAAIAQPGALGDVIACLPMAAALKAWSPQTRIVFIGRAYSRSLIEACGLVDQFVEAEEVSARPGMLAELEVDAFFNPYLFPSMGQAARRAGVGLRTGNLQRPGSLLWANRFITQASRTVQRHRALLNLAYLRPLGITDPFTLEQLKGAIRLDRVQPLRGEVRALLADGSFNLVLHPYSNGSAREWPAAHFAALAQQLSGCKVKIFVTGLEIDRERLPGSASFLRQPHVVDLVGKLDLSQLIAFLHAADGFVGASTGPLHIAAGVGIHALGLFPGRARATAVRWHPLGPKAEAMSSRVLCTPGPGRCPARFAGEACACMSDIAPQRVAERVLAWAGDGV